METKEFTTKSHLKKKKKKKKKKKNPLVEYSQNSKQKERN